MTEWFTLVEWDRALFEAREGSESGVVNENGDWMVFESFEDAAGMARFMLEDPSFGDDHLPLLGILAHDYDPREGEPDDPQSWSAGWMGTDLVAREGDYENEPDWQSLGKPDLYIVCPFGDAAEHDDAGDTLVLATAVGAIDAACGWLDAWARYLAEAPEMTDDPRGAWVEVVALGYDPRESERGPARSVGFVGHERTLLEGAPELDEHGGRKVLADGEVIAAAPAQDVAAD